MLNRTAYVKRDSMCFLQIFVQESFLPNVYVVKTKYKIVLNTPVKKSLPIA